MIVLEKIDKSFLDGHQKKVILEEASVTVEQGEQVAIMGRSGLGKTTLLKVMSGIDKVDKGKIVVSGIEVTKYNKKELTALHREKMAFVFQNFNLLPNLSVEDNIMLPLFFYKKKSKQHTSLNEVLDSVELSYSMKDQSINKLSGGEKQRVAIARALINSPEIIFADEPTGNLDQGNENKILQLMNFLNEKRGITIVTVTHSPVVAAAMNRVITIKDRRIVTVDNWEVGQ